MNEVYVIEFEAYHHYSGTDMENKTERSVFGVFDTGRRAICYLRRFLDEKDKYLAYFDHYLKTEEDKAGYMSAEARRRYRGECECYKELVTETLTMRRMQLNELRAPSDEIIDLYC